MTAQIISFPGKRHKRMLVRYHLTTDGRAVILGAIVNGQIEAWCIGDDGELKRELLAPDVVFINQWAGEDCRPADTDGDAA